MVKLVAVVVGLGVLVVLWTVDISKTTMVVISVVWVIGLYGWAWISGQRRRRAGYIDSMENTAYSYSWRDRSPSIGNPGGYRYADEEGSSDAGDSDSSDAGERGSDRLP